jgi:hypothetical protein
MQRGVRLRKKGIVVGISCLSLLFVSAGGI